MMSPFSNKQHRNIRVNLHQTRSVNTHVYKYMSVFKFEQIFGRRSLNAHSSRSCSLRKKTDVEHVLNLGIKGFVFWALAQLIIRRTHSGSRKLAGLKCPSRIYFKGLQTYSSIIELIFKVHVKTTTRCCLFDLSGS